MSLLIRPQPEPHESWPGFLLRLSNRNNYPGLYYLSQIAGIPVFGLIASGPLKVLPKLGYSAIPHDPTQNCTSNWSLHQRLYTFGRSAFGRVCPTCLAEGCGFISSHWDHPLQLTCAVHNTLLVDRCPRCSAEINYMRAHIMSCRCGADFRWIECEDPPSWLHRLYSELQIPEPSTRQLELFAPFDRADVLAAFLLVKLARLNRASHRQEFRATNRLSTYFDFIRRSDLRALADWFSPWPRGFIAQLARLELNGKKTSFDLLGTADFPRLHTLVKSVSTCRRRMARPGKKQNDDPIVGNEVNLKKFLKGTNSTYDRFMYWLEKGLLQGVYVTKRKQGTQQFHIPANEYLEVLNLVNRTAKPREIFNAYQIPRTTLKSFVNAGVLDVVYLNRAKYVFHVHVAQVSELMRQTLAVARHPLPKSIDPLPVDRAISLLERSTKPLIKSFMTSLMSGEVPLFVPKGAHKQWDNLVLDKAEFSRWTSQMHEE